AELFRDRYGVTERGNFEGRTVLTLSRSVESLAEEYDLSEEEVRERLENARRELFEAREARPRPPRDEKVLAGWNGLMISALAEGALVLDPEFADPAVDALEFCRTRLWDDDERRLHRRFTDGDVGIPGYLEDYAFLGRGALDVYQATGAVEHLAFALDLARTVRDAFYDDAEGTLYFTPVDGESLVARPQELTDASTPSSTGVAVQLLARLAHVAPDEGFEDVARTVVETHASTVESNPLGHASLTLAADDLAAGLLELTVAAEALPESWRDPLARTYLPTRFLSRRPPTDADLEAWLSELDLESVPPIWAGREARDGRPTVYACRAFTCSPPRHDLADALAWAAGELEETADSGPATGVSDLQGSDDTEK
ncbi:MAG: thioredoxin domain-containing protein, partial [Natronomonas sp.]